MSIRKNILQIGAYTLLPLLLLFLAACSEKEEVIRAKLDIILDDDMGAIVESVAVAALLKRPYFDLLEYRVYDEGAYIRMAIVDFYFLESAGYKISRKYRYHRRFGLWDRYYNKYYTIAPDSNDGGDNGAPGDSMPTDAGHEAAKRFPSTPAEENTNTLSTGFK